MKMKINWYPGHMAKAKRLIKDQIKLIDVVYELIDARIPYSSKVEDFANLYLNKPKILIMTKYDICDQRLTDQWVKFYEQQGNTVIKTSAPTGDGINKIIGATYELLTPLLEKTKNKGLLQKKIRALIIGVPNVGKSTLINRITKKKKTITGNRPGVTKGKQWIRVNDKIDLLDTPGIMPSNITNVEVGLNLAAMTAIKEDILPLDDVAVHILRKLAKTYPKVLKERYKLETTDLDDILESFDKIAKIRGIAPRNNEIDYDLVSKVIIKDLREGKFGKVTFDLLGNY